MITSEVLSPTTTITASSSFAVPSQNQAQSLFSFLKTANSCISFDALYNSIFEHLSKVFEIDFSLVIASNQIIYSKKYSETTFLLNEEEIKTLENENKLQKLVVTQNENIHYFIYIPIQKSNQLLNVFVCISKNNYSTIDNQTIGFLDCFCQMILSALIRLDKEENDIRYKTIFDSFQDIYFQANQEGIITTISPSIKDILGYEPQEVINKALYAFLLSKERLENLLFILKERKKIKNYEVNVLSKLGHPKRFLCNFQVIENKANRNIVAIEGIAREVNESKKVNQEVKKSKQNIERILESKKQFLADMGHEIRTPMNGIIGMIDLLRTTKLNNEQNNFVDTIEESSNELLVILNNVLDLSKIEANKMLLKPEAFELKSLLDELSLLFAKEIKKKSLQFAIKITDKTPKKIIADKSRLLQIFGYLLSNAIKYNLQNGKIIISVDVLKQEDGKLFLQCEVKDTGIGISEENQEFLFDSFSKLQHNYQKIAGGTGLGLTIAKQLVKIMGGTLQVYSKEKEGSTFYFSFEALKSIEKSTVNKSVDNSEIQSECQDNKVISEIGLNWQNSFINNPLILVVDDNTTNLIVAQKVLEKSGCQVITAVNGKEAIHKIRNNKFELVYMDIQMPEMDGVTATRFIKRLKIHVPPIIALTAFTVAEEKDRFIDAGMDDYLPKPVKAETLIQKTKQWISEKFYNLNNENSKKEIENDTEDKNETEKANLASQSSVESLKYLPIVNTQTAQQLQKWGGQELVDESYELFETETKGLLVELIMAHQQNDRPTLKLHVHTIKGSAATLGVDRMATLATEIDLMLKSDIDSNVAEQMQAFEHSFEEYRLNYRIILNL
ncbi:PAS domain S-box [Bernardetia litoralis DSM 6794]|uniref:histidine kinase n=1 Tax=Bernardetia litoralis (strain ATCC 23117 / DSM 6794 / NBRC 15988 / NCIMB 1366 / Fx l1 / Sio-4) TaxID=880071 RepID=I4AG45_BERLS|nr:response regulator [Bernardetia litoralis]AFM02930.1 PAS domain S-box [Bernardetia litoralis DSM 6794]